MRGLITQLGYYLVARNALPVTVVNGLSDLVDRTVLRALLQQLRINCILDVGAHSGSFAVNVRRLGYTGQIVSFEPTPETYAQLTARLARDPAWRGYQLALGAEDTTATFNLTALSNLNSFLTPRGMGVTGQTTVEVRRLDRIFDEVIAGIETPRVFLKIDTQGFDVEVLRGAAGCLERIVGLQSEISVEPVYQRMPHYLDALAYYESLGFRLANLCLASRHKASLRVVEYDCLMYRPETPKAASA